MTQIARFFASLGVDVDTSQLRKVDAYLKSVERKLINFGKRINKTTALHLNVKVNVNTNEIVSKVRAAIHAANQNATVRISRFAIDQAALNRSLRDAMRQFRGNNQALHLRVNLDVAVGNGLRNQIRTIVITAVRDAMRGGGGGGGPGPGGGRGHLGNAGAVGAGSLLARSMAPLLALGAGGYGLSQINQKNQEVISAQLTTMAVTEAAGLKGKGPEAFEWLRGQGNRIGFNYVDQAQDYNNFLSNSLGAGQNLDQAQDTYLGFAEYSKAMGVSAYRNKLVMGALSQMTGKGTISMQELKQQMGESLPGTMSIFAEAYQKSTGGKLTGQEAIAKLLKDVPEGKLKSSEILPYVAEIMRERAKPKLDIASKTSASQQARFENMVSDTSINAGKSGVEEGFARLFKTLTATLKEAAPLVDSMASGFNEMTKSFAFLSLLPQSIQRAMDGRDSYVAKVLGPENTKIMADMFNSFKETTKEISTALKSAVGAWGEILKSIGPELLTFVSALTDIFLYTFKMINQAIAGNIVGKGGAADAGKALQFRLAGGSREDAAKIAAGENPDKFVPDENRALGYLEVLKRLTPGGFINNMLSKQVASGMENVPTLMETFRKTSPPGLVPQAGTIDALGYKQVDMSGIQPMPRLSGSGVPQLNKAIPLTPTDVVQSKEDGLLGMLRDKFAASANKTTNNSFSVQISVDPATLNNMDVGAQAADLGAKIEEWWDNRMTARMAETPDNSN